MKKFNFQLQKLLDLRQFDEDKAKEDLGKFVSMANIINIELETIALQRVETKKKPQETYTISEFRAVEHYINRLDIKKDELLVELANLEVIIEQKRKVFIDAMKNRKVLTKLKEKKETQWKKETARAEELFIDDVTSSKYIRNYE